MDADKVFALFPRLDERRGNLGHQLSGGEQQMLAFGRALVLNPRLLLLDEPLEGLAPLIVQELLAAIRRVARDEGLPSIIVEQHPHMVLARDRRRHRARPRRRRLPRHQRRVARRPRAAGRLARRRRSP